ncbi:GFA family protein [Sphingomonas sp. Tas61C01]|uniref:GFA family protein n=1 Tax=Sphingomonas sp. Tas61C01 TaxID=3458297 RepID=UPI00403E5025
MAIEGRCRCGACNYRIEIDTLPAVYACHCHVCQRWSGSAFSLQALVAETALAVTGPVITYEIVTEDRTSTQRFCGTCHTRLYNTNTRRPGVAVVRAGTLDRSEEIVCIAHIFTTYRQRWVTISDAVPSWPEAPPPADFIRLFSG